MITLKDLQEKPGRWHLCGEYMVRVTGYDDYWEILYPKTRMIVSARLSGRMGDYFESFVTSNGTNVGDQPRGIGAIILPKEKADVIARMMSMLKGGPPPTPPARKPAKKGAAS